MPMIPSPLAALAYAAVKIGGYSYFAARLNGIIGTNVRPIRFGLAKTGIGLLGGLVYFYLLSVWGDEHLSDAKVFVGALPVRLIAWGIALGIFYGFRSKPMLVVAALLVGVVWSYALDGAMWLIYKIMPGMVMPFC